MSTVVESLTSVLVYGYIRSSSVEQIPRELIIIVLKFIQMVQDIILFEEKLFYSMERTSCSDLSERIKIYYPAVGPQQFIELCYARTRARIFIARDCYNVYKDDKLVSESLPIQRRLSEQTEWRHEDTFTAPLKESTVNHLEISIGRGTNCPCIPQSSPHLAVKIYNDNATWDGNDAIAKGKSEDEKAGHIFVETGVKILDNNSHHVRVSVECNKIEKIRFSSMIGVCCEQAKNEIGYDWIYHK